MKKILSFTLLVSLFVGTALAEVAPPLVFSGVLRDQNGYSVVLSDPKTGDSQWLTAGQTFQGYLRALNPDVEWNRLRVGQAVRVHP